MLYAVAYISNKEMSEQSVEKNNKYASAASNFNGLQCVLIYVHSESSLSGKLLVAHAFTNTSCSALSVHLL